MKECPLGCSHQTFPNHSGSALTVAANLLLENKKSRSNSYINTFCGRTPKSVLVRHYTDYNPSRLRKICSIHKLSLTFNLIQNMNCY